MKNVVAIANRKKNHLSDSYARVRSGADDGDLDEGLLVNDDAGHPLTVICQTRGLSSSNDGVSERTRLVESERRPPADWDRGNRHRMVCNRTTGSGDGE